MGSVFNPLILMDKLAKLNSSQQSIETLSHWCIFHMNKAKQVVETWDKQFHCSPHDQRLAFLYLANDILQNSRRKGAEFVGEFWKVLPDALRDVIENGDEFGRNAALRLISIWEERKVFGSRGSILKDEFVGRYLDISNRNVKPSGMRLRPSAGNAVEKIVSSYQLVYGGQLDEESVLNKCKSSISFFEKVDKEMGGDLRSGCLNETGLIAEFKGRYATFRESIEQLTSLELSMSNLVTHLREALQEQEYKLDQVRGQLQAAHAHSEVADSLYRQLPSGNNSEQVPSEHGKKENHMAQSRKFVSGSKEQSAPVMYTRQVSFAENSGSIKDDPKSAAAAMAAKLTASTSSAEMLTYVLSSLASEGAIRNQMKESSNDFPADKRPKLESEPPYVPGQNSQPQIPSFSQSESVQHSVPSTSQDFTSNEQLQPPPPPPPPPPPSSPPPVAPLPPMLPYPVAQYIPTAAGTIIPTNGPYGYGGIQQQPGASLAGFPPVGPPGIGVAPFAAPAGNMYQTYPNDGSFYSQASSLPMTPVSRQ